jgi:hypothetical protein
MSDADGASITAAAAAAAVGLGFWLLGWRRRVVDAAALACALVERDLGGAGGEEGVLRRGPGTLVEWVGR